MTVFFHYSFVPRIIPVDPSGNTVSHIHRSKKPPLPKGGVGGDSVSPSRQHRAKGDLFRTPREGRPYVLFFIRPLCPLRPCGAPPPRGGGLYMGRFVNRKYGRFKIAHTSSLHFSLFTIHSSLNPPPPPLRQTTLLIFPRNSDIIILLKHPFERQRQKWKTPPFLP